MGVVLLLKLLKSQSLLGNSESLKMSETQDLCLLNFNLILSTAL